MILSMAIADIRNDNELIAITQRFVGGGIHGGEALVELHGKDIHLFGEKLGLSQTDEYKNEVVIDIANLMVSSFLVALSEQINYSIFCTTADRFRRIYEFTSYLW